MQIIVSKRLTEVKGIINKMPKPQTTQISTTFAGCYNMEKIGKQQFCFVFDRGMEF